MPPQKARAKKARTDSVDVDRLSELLSPWIPDAQEREFVVRCIAKEGPVHHRQASYALFMLLGEVLERLGGAPDVDPHEGVAVPLRLPPHARNHMDAQARESTYPLRLPTAALERIAPKAIRAQEAFTSALLDGPPHHALANAGMVCLLQGILRRLDETGSAD